MQLMRMSSDEDSGSAPDSGRSTPEEIRRIAGNVWNDLLAAQQNSSKSISQSKRISRHVFHDSSPAKNPVKLEPAEVLQLSSPSPSSSTHQHEDDEDNVGAASMKLSKQNNSKKLSLANLSKKSLTKYEKSYNQFKTWLKSCNYNQINENIVLEYFDHLAETLKPSSLWWCYSSLRTTIEANFGINIANYSQLLNTLREKQLNHTVEEKTTKFFTADEVKSFLTNASDKKYLDLKTVMIFGVSGACRASELINITTDAIDMHDNVWNVKIPHPKTKVLRTFKIEDEYLEIVQKYYAKRPESVDTNRFFLNYQKSKCTRQVIGKNKIATMPSRIAEILQLPDPKAFSGNAFHKTSMMRLAKSGARIDEIAKYGGWKSSVNARRYVNRTTGTTAIARRKSSAFGEDNSCLMDASTSEDECSTYS